VGGPADRREVGVDSQSTRVQHRDRLSQNSIPCPGCYGSNRGKEFLVVAVFRQTPTCPVFRVWRA